MSAAAAPPTALAAECAGADTIPSAETVDVVAEATVCLLNEERAAQGLPLLERADVLDSASSAYSQQMVSEAFFDHVSPDGSTIVERLRAAGYGNHTSRTWVIGENIAWGQDVAATPRNIVAQWMASPGHRRNVLSDRYAHVGIGIALGVPVDQTWGATYTTDFGLLDRLRLPVCRHLGGITPIDRRARMVPASAAALACRSVPGRRTPTGAVPVP